MVNKGTQYYHTVANDAYAETVMQILPCADISNERKSINKYFSYTLCRECKGGKEKKDKKIFKKKVSVNSSVEKFNPNARIKKLSKASQVKSNGTFWSMTWRK